MREIASFQNLREKEPTGHGKIRAKRVELKVDQLMLHRWFYFTFFSQHPLEGYVFASLENIYF